jgi:hypothetical protein
LHFDCSDRSLGAVSVTDRRGEIDFLSQVFTNLPEPRVRIAPMNQAFQKAQQLAHVVAVAADVVLGDLGIEVKKAIHAAGFGEIEMGSSTMARLPWGSIRSR